MRDSLVAIFWLSLGTVPVFVAQFRGLSKVCRFGSASLGYEAAQLVLYVLFSDTCMYWQHRLFHRPLLFNMFHKKHHQ